MKAKAMESVMKKFLKMGYRKKVELKVAEVEVPNAFAVGNIFQEGHSSAQWVAESAGQGGG
jgi:hypothetical protein